MKTSTRNILGAAALAAAALSTAALGSGPKADPEPLDPPRREAGLDRLDPPILVGHKQAPEDEAGIKSPASAKDRDQTDRPEAEPPIAEFIRRELTELKAAGQSEAAVSKLLKLVPYVSIAKETDQPERADWALRIFTEHKDLLENAATEFESLFRLVEAPGKKLDRLTLLENALEYSGSNRGVVLENVYRLHGPVLRESEEEALRRESGSMRSELARKQSQDREGELREMARYFAARLGIDLERR